jgi:polysaccharide biosynthesis/export protein
MHSFASRRSLLLFALAAVLVPPLGGCALAPGMQASRLPSAQPAPAQPASPGASVEPAIDVPVTEITSESAAREASLYADARAPSPEILALVGEPPPYRIGPTDLLSIIVWNHPELVVPTLTYDVNAAGAGVPPSVGLTAQNVPGYSVSHDGYIQFPFVRLLRVAGLTEIEAQQQLTEKLKPYINDAQITLRVVGYRSKKVYVSGNVGQPGPKAITDVPMTLASALSAASGIQDSGAAEHIELMRQGKRYRIDLPALEQYGIDPSRIPLVDSDLLRVPPRSDFNVFAIGELNRPGALPFRTDGRLTLSQAIGDAGGVNPLTGNPAEIYLIRPATPEQPAKVFHLNAKTPQALVLAQNFELKPNDVIYVDAAAVTRWNRVVSQLLGTALAGDAIRHTVSP